MYFYQNMNYLSFLVNGVNSIHCCHIAYHPEFLNVMNEDISSESVMKLFLILYLISAFVSHSEVSY